MKESALSAMAIRRVSRRRSIASEVADEIRATIFAQTIGAGDHLGTETEVASAFGVSRPTMREALSALEAQGVVARQPGAGGGVVVAQPEATKLIENIAIQSALMKLDWKELLDTQQAVETATVWLAAKLADEQQITRLRDIQAATERAVGNAHEFSSAGMEFHLAVAEISQNRLLQTLMQAVKQIRVQGSTRRAAALSTKTLQARHREILKHHDAILSALQTKDADGAMRAMSKHLEANRAKHLEDDEPGEDHDGQA